MKELPILDIHQLNARALMCQAKNLDFVSLQPIPDGVTIGSIFHNELGFEVKTQFVSQPISSKK